KSASVRKPRVVIGIKQSCIDWNSLDGTEAKLIFMIAVPQGYKGKEHLKFLQMLSQKLMYDCFRERL
ncbi:PTS sugar transporter subunit IIA, partial [Bacillus cereus]|uniref:PTS sugar transporter subunit IIA n=1 Tax=Bacillus cereus TaxID=1396 RepID=UPI00284371F0